MMLTKSKYLIIALMIGAVVNNSYALKLTINNQLTDTLHFVADKDRSKWPSHIPAKDFARLMIKSGVKFTVLTVSGTEIKKVCICKTGTKKGACKSLTKNVNCNVVDSHHNMVVTVNSL